MGEETGSIGGYGLRDLLFLRHLFHYSPGWILSDQSTFERRPWPWRAGAIERGAARAADATRYETEKGICVCLYITKHSTYFEPVVTYVDHFF